jgi:diacylglycerol kinase family enzyme
LAACENRLTDFGIFGKVIRITTFTNPGSILQDEVRRGAKTAIIVGNDDTFARVMARCAHLSIIFGFISVEEQSTIGHLLGIPSDVGACDVISRRKIEKIDVGSVNDRFFFRQIMIEGGGMKVVSDDIFSIAPEHEAQIAICNLDVPEWIEHQSIRPQDGRLTVYVRPVKKSLFRKKFERPTMLQSSHVTVKGEKPFFCTIDGIVAKEQYIDARVSGKTFSVIVGKARKF